MRSLARWIVVPMIPLLGVAGTARRSRDDALKLTISGHVTDARSGAGLPGIEIALESASPFAITNAEGDYVLALPNQMSIGAKVRVTARGVGFAVDVKEVEIKTGTTTLDFALRFAPVALDEVVVTGAINRRERQSGSSVIGYTATEQFAPTGLPGRYDANFNTEAYAHFEDNPFLNAVGNPLSTFSIDVDRASYSNIRRFIREGRRPPQDAVRIEEMINYFPYAYPAPEGDAPFSITTDVAPAPWQPVHKLVRIGIQARRLNIESLPPSNLVFLIDVSGSMQTPDKLPLLKASFNLLVNELRAVDRVAIVVYAGAAGLVLPPTPGDRKDQILDAINRLEAGGSTAGGEGIQLAYRAARENYIDGGNNRVILATDGDFNVGASSDAEMVRLIEKMRGQGTFLTVLGFGTGNLQDSKMEQIADHGNGHFAYIDNLMEARKVLVHEIGATLFTIAKDVKFQVEFNPQRVQGYRLIGYENRLLRNEDFNDDMKDAGDLGAGHSVTALYEIIPVGVESPVQIRDVDSLRYRVRGDVHPTADASELLYVKLRFKRPNENSSGLLQHPVTDSNAEISGDFRFTAAVASFGMLLRDSPYVSPLGLSDVLAMAKASLGDDEEGYRAEFVRLVERVIGQELLSRTNR